MTGPIIRGQDETDMTISGKRSVLRTRRPAAILRSSIGIRAARAMVCAALMLGSAQTTDAQKKSGSDPQHKLPLTWDRWLDHDEIGERLKLIEKTWPNFLKLRSLGKSYGGRDIYMMTINNPATGAENDKAAMFIEANVHGNEIQGGEVSLYTIWYLMENYDRIPDVKRIVDERVFYIVPTINPDGRDYFLHGAGGNSRTGHVPVDDDGDGKVDEDGPDDLNANNMIEQIRKYVPGQGTHRISHSDPRIMEPVPPGEKGDWIMLGSEGLDNDADGRIDEDGLGGYDPNRNYGSDWQPNYVQGGSMDYPFQLPESRASNDFWMKHPNIAGLQTFHNSGGMILRPPGMAWFGDFPASDIRAYDEIGETGERMLPYYDYLVIWRGLYTVHGGSIDWTNDGLGILSYSNELWSDDQYYNSPLLQKQAQDRDSPISGQRSSFFFDDFLEFKSEYVTWKPFDHPVFGKVEIGGTWRKLHGRVNPRFMSMELFHRNMAFTLFHADQMPLMKMDTTTVQKVDGDVYRVRVDVTNKRIIPTIMEKAALNKVVRPDLLTVEGKNVQIITAGWVPNKFKPGAITMIDQKELNRIMLRNGLQGKTTRTIEYLVKGSGSMTVKYSSVKGGTVSKTVDLR
jgi:hypothetical protein